ncbi:hypothetical protein ABZU75_23335 [Streptosporangium sp. NPDC005286]|uniref:hypothetical protein n=1 Tax=Streptosporangium sp. NPDC005286 TaxID=3154463 RepID=UPI0033B41E39
MWRVVPLALLTALVTGCGSGATAPTASAMPSPNPFNAAACSHYVTALARLDENVADGQANGYVPIGLQVDTRDGEKEVRRAAEGETKRAMERTAPPRSASSGWR